MKLGILGGGQLARMLALAAHPLGIEVVFVDPQPDACAAPVARQIQANYADPAALAQLADQVDRVTFEFENVAAESARYLAEHLPVFPSYQALEQGQDRWSERSLFRRLGIPQPEFLPVDSLADLQAAVTAIGFPAMLKTRCQGYDGKGQALIREASEVARAWKSVGEQPSLLEALVAFSREISVFGARDAQGRLAIYPLSENSHDHGILHLAISQPQDPFQAQAAAYLTKLMEHLDYIGVMALELFQEGDCLLANEFAPRVHNSAHWTLEGAETSQFENHVRAVCGLPLGGTEALGHAAMVNCIGQMPDVRDVLALSGAHLHHYGKQERPGRKLGHIGLRCPSKAALLASIEKALTLSPVC